eukprot:UN24380
MCVFSRTPRVHFQGLQFKTLYLPPCPSNRISISRLFCVKLHPMTDRTKISAIHSSQSQSYSEQKICKRQTNQLIRTAHQIRHSSQGSLSNWNISRTKYLFTCTAKNVQQQASQQRKGISGHSGVEKQQNDPPQGRYGCWMISKILFFVCMRSNNRKESHNSNNKDPHKVG